MILFLEGGNSFGKVFLHLGCLLFSHAQLVGCLFPMLFKFLNGVLQFEIGLMELFLEVVDLILKLLDGGASIQKILLELGSIVITFAHLRVFILDSRVEVVNCSSECANCFILHVELHLQGRYFSFKS